MRLTFDYLKENYYYWCGRLWRISTQQPVGTPEERNGNYYLRVNIKGELHYVHRLIFWLENGYLPTLVDHKNQNTLDNSIENLRDLSHSLNLLNARVKKNNTSGFTGVRWNRKAKKYIARVSYKNKEYHLGCFDSLEEAVSARKLKIDTLFKEM